MISPGEYGDHYVKVGVAIRDGEDLMARVRVLAEKTLGQYVISSTVERDYVIDPDGQQQTRDTHLPVFAGEFTIQPANELELLLLYRGFTPTEVDNRGSRPKGTPKDPSTQSASAQLLNMQNRKLLKRLRRSKDPYLQPELIGVLDAIKTDDLKQHQERDEMDYEEISFDRFMRLQDASGGLLYMLAPSPSSPITGVLASLAAVAERRLNIIDSTLAQADSFNAGVMLILRAHPRTPDRKLEAFEFAMMSEDILGQKLNVGDLRVPYDSIAGR
jgi:hypothetical protein